MTKSKFKIAFIFLIMGFIFLALDVDVKTPFTYPHAYNNTKDVIGEFQYYNIASNYGAKCTYKFIDNSSDSDKSPLVQSETTTSSASTSAKVIDKVFYDNIHVDIFSDLIGFILIFIACVLLKKVNKKFIFCSLCAFCGIILRIILKSLPFVLNGLLLCNTAMFLGIAYIASIVATTYLFTRGLFSMCSDICCRDERKWGKITWFAATALQILLVFIFWIGSDFGALMTLGYVFEAFLVLDVIIFWIILRRTYYYLEKAYLESVSK